MKINLTDDSLRALRLPRDAAQLVTWDDKVPGFGVVLGRTSATFIVNRRVDKVLHREAIGRWPEMSAREARKLALVRLGKLVDKKPTPGKVKRAARSGPTLAEACALYVAKLGREGARPTSISTVQREIGSRKDDDHQGSYLSAWLDRPLASITGKECRARHEQITADHGSHVANRVMRELRAIWNHLAREIVAGMVDGVESFPTSPTLAVVVNTERTSRDHTERRREPVAWEDLPAWHAAVMTSEPVRRDYHLVAILTGLRRNDLATLRWDRVNTTDEPIRKLAPMSILLPVPKGGKSRAFSIPISSEVARILDARKVENTSLGQDDGGWVFPTTALVSDEDRTAPCYLCRDLGMPPHARGARIHLVDPNRGGHELMVSPHRLRDTYTTALAELKDPPLSPYVIDVLTNHRPPRGSVTAGYIGTLDVSVCQERVSEFIVARFTAPKPSKSRSRKLHSVAA